MGYTHSWDIKVRPTNDQWSSIQAAVQILFRTSGAKKTIQYESLRFTPAVVDREHIQFNGKKDDSCETFYFDRWKGSEFCKTWRKPYDVYVVACLAIIKHFAPDRVDVRTDGDPEDWEAGIELAESVIGVKFNGYIRHN